KARRNQTAGRGTTAEEKAQTTKARRLLAPLSISIPDLVSRDGLLTIPEIFDVDVRAEAHVVGEIPADVIRVVINYDVVRIPQPAVAESDVVRSHVEIETTEPEPAGAAATQVPDVVRAESAGEVAVLPRMIHVVVRIIRAGVMPDPSLALVDVRRIGVARRVTVVTMFLHRVGITLKGRGAASGRLGMHCFVLRESENRKKRNCCKEPDRLVHVLHDHPPRMKLAGWFDTNLAEMDER